MKSGKLFCAALVAAVCLAMIGAVAEPAKDKAGAQPEIKLPPGWTAEDMQACMLASTPGKMHEKLAKGAGVWEGKQTMWMYAGAEPMKSDCTSKVTPIMDGRYLKMEFSGETPGMGPFSGFGITGFDNVSGKVVSTWIDSWSTGILNGVGELSEDGKTMTMNFKYNCPLTKKPAVLRQIETTTGPNTKTLEMFSTDPKSGKEYKMMAIEFTKK